ncbi:MAG: RecX family transcriptional regulator [Sphingomicrobium sp.]
MNRSERSRRPRPPLVAATLDEVALTYVARFATSRAKLATYLRRKLKERGWEGEADPPVAQIVERLSGLGYVDDAAFAASKARSLRSRGYGNRRVSSALYAAGIGEEERAPALDCSAEETIVAALHFARRRRFGPFAAGDADRVTRQKWLAAMLRAGHGLDLSRQIILLPPGIEPDPQQLMR